MIELRKEDMLNINGGANAILITTIIGTIITFIVGTLKGQIKLKWQNRKNIEFKGNSEGKPLIQIRRKD